MRKLALYTIAILLAARDGEELLHKRSPNAEEKPLLIPEVFQAIAMFGRELRQGDAETSALGREVADADPVRMLDACKLSSEHAGPLPEVCVFLSEASAARVEELRHRESILLDGWTAYLAARD